MESQSGDAPDLIQVICQCDQTSYKTFKGLLMCGLGTNLPRGVVISDVVLYFAATSLRLQNISYLQFWLLYNIYIY